MIKVGDTVRINDKQDFPLPPGLNVGDLVQVKDITNSLYLVCKIDCGICVRTLLKQNEFDVIKTGVE